jgi:hypothetical protein
LVEYLRVETFWCQEFGQKRALDLALA